MKNLIKGKAQVQRSPKDRAGVFWGFLTGNGGDWHRHLRDCGGNWNRPCVQVCPHGCPTMSWPSGWAGTAVCCSQRWCWPCHPRLTALLSTFLQLPFVSLWNCNKNSHSTWGAWGQAGIFTCFLRIFHTLIFRFVPAGFYLYVMTNKASLLQGFVYLHFLLIVTIFFLTKNAKLKAVVVYWCEILSQNKMCVRVLDSNT